MSEVFGGEFWEVHYDEVWAEDGDKSFLLVEDGAA